MSGPPATCIRARAFTHPSPFGCSGWRPATRPSLPVTSTVGRCGCQFHSQSGGGGGGGIGDAFAGPSRAAAAAAGTPYRRPALGRSWAALPAASLNVDVLPAHAEGGWADRAAAPGGAADRRLGVWVSSKTAPAAWTAVRLTAAGVHD